MKLQLFLTNSLCGTDSTMVLDAAGLSSQSRTRVRTAEDRNREAWQPWRGRAFLAAWQGQTRRVVTCPGKPPSQNWKSFLTNHAGEMAAIDFFTVPTVTFKVLYGFVVLLHDRRSVDHFNVTAHPTNVS